MVPETIPARLQARAKDSPNKAAYYVKQGGSWVPTSYVRYAAEVRQAARAMIALGLEPLGAISILGSNRPEWTIADLACMSAGGVPAGIYTTCSSSEVRYIVEHSESRLAIIENADQWKKLEKEVDTLPKLHRVVLMKGAKVDHPKVMTWEQLMAEGDKVSDGAFDERLAKLRLEDLATLIYTSGTTGPPKGVMLSHRNLAFTAGLVDEMLPVGGNDYSLSYLPLSHIAEQMFSVHVPVTYGTAIYFAESLEKVPDNLKEVQPTTFFAVPRIWEKFHAGVSGKMKAAPPLRQKIAGWAMRVGREVNEKKNRGQQPTGRLRLQYELAKRLVYAKVKPALGLGNAKYCVSGAAPVAKEILEFFSGLDVVIYEVYGQSEDCGPTSFNLPGTVKFGSVGTRLPGIDVKIAGDGEICVKGPNVFMGYYKDEAATKEALVDGWLRSGDLGSFDDDGFLFITGRKKDIIITAGGKNVTPTNIEAALKNTPLIGEAVVIGDRRPYLTALLWLKDGVQASPELSVQIQKDVDAVNEQLARVEQVRKWVIPRSPLSIDTGELTPTMKVKRRTVSERFGEDIEAMYRT